MMLSASEARCIRTAGAVVLGNVVEPATVWTLRTPGPHGAWWTQGLRMGRILPFGPHSGFLWMIHLALLVLYTLLALAFPGALTRCGNVLVERPGVTLLTGLLAVLALPFLFVSAAGHGGGDSRGALGAAAGHRVDVPLRQGERVRPDWPKSHRRTAPPAAAVLVGGLLVLVVSVVPILGLLLSLLLSALGFCCAAAALFSMMQRPAAPKPVAPPPAPGPAPVVSAPAQPEPVPAPVAPPALEAPPPVLTPPSPPTAPPAHASLIHSAPQVSFVGLPRAGFWIRFGALLIDLILVAIITAPFRHVFHVSQFGNNVSVDSPGMLPLLALYGALMWKLRGTTVGGIIFGLKVVRLDDRPIDWATAIVRALGSFLSLMVFGLGFIWVAFDQEKQSWHDKIAGTVVVRVPKGVPLV